MFKFLFCFPLLKVWDYMTSLNFVCKNKLNLLQDKKTSSNICDLFFQAGEDSKYVSIFFQQKILENVNLLFLQNRKDLKNMN